MTHDFDIDTPGAAPIVYVRPVDQSELPANVRAQLEDVSELYAVHDASGARLALVTDRDAAFLLARQNEMSPVHVH
ncbi:protein of unknown function DUF1150 [Dinoroseobacter shibae DFL 12 = DSM 16493]|jgi:hypothetical protein|uniref:DUF1150 family protein n=1 Tax=Dinoroseobacter shibae (strain DSM 16493 / NCIMB 14021 / DFL 12) TaxID=398580 RepID=A8LQE4_DINSH|nr:MULTISPECIES: DUF1150 family protein [Dinoroseobacter]ABV92430.1 protein of unknown function DUF1150 [Dinoroseobacter shibae DFL 12 = DSM 16493]MDD9718313.1 DUF1150 family protein [Dinoroseobacter sp. PD6]URF47375.1 DUF1150 domain-containing protein [Dinoroseobacter shibae]URF51686.1 DUF1150 domain-containing protein [Dinoroseobacter shibae]